MTFMCFLFLLINIIKITTLILKLDFFFYFNNLLCYFFSLCSKLDGNTEFKSVTAKEKLNGYKVGEEITCFVSKVSSGNS